MSNQGQRSFHGFRRLTTRDYVEYFEAVLYLRMGKAVPRLIRNIQGREENGVFSLVSTENRLKDTEQHENTRKGSVQEIASEFIIKEKRDRNIPRSAS